MPKSGKKLLTMRIAAANNGVSISIEDNGVGRRQAAQKQKSHKSVGTQLAHESFEALSALLNLKADLTITDKLDTEGRPAGTIVTIVIPQINMQHAS
jgi:sensor histidine kinase YesM